MKVQNLPTVDSVQAFAMAIARNIACDWLRHQKVVSISLAADLDLEVSLDGQPDDLLDIDQQLEAFADIVESMPFRRRQVFTLRKVHGMSQKEIAQVLGITVNTVEQHLTKAARNVARLFGYHAHPSSVLRQTRSIGKLSSRSAPILVSKTSMPRPGLSAPRREPALQRSNPKTPISDPADDCCAPAAYAG